MKIEFSNYKIDNLPKDNQSIVINVFKNKLGKKASAIDKQFDSVISKAIKSEKFEGKLGEILSLNLNHKDNLHKLFVVGMGDAKALKEFEISNAGGKILSTLDCNKASDAVFILDDEGCKIPSKLFICNFAFGVLLKSYKFNKYFTKNKDKHELKVSKINFMCDDSKNINTLFAKFEANAQGINFARDLVSEPPNVLYPESYANIIKKTLEPLGVKVTILDKKQLEKLGMNTLLGVCQGSAKEARVVVVEWYGSGSKKDIPISFIGKGVTFDTGGISLKPSGGMEDMKYDMGGSAAVVGTIYSLAKRNAKVNAVGVVGLVENMPGGNAQRPSDVVTSMSGQTVEVLNTDAEGRLVLCDIMWYCQKTFKPKVMIDLATLTGAIVVALGKEYAGLFSNDDKLSEQLFKTGQICDEKLWRMPLNDVYDKLMDSDIADMRNISNGKGPGSITAAQFLQRFVDKGTKWAHLDIAGVAWADSAKDICPKGATGFGVKLLDQLVQDYYE